MHVPPWNTHFIYLLMEIVAIDDDPLLLHTIKMVLEEDFGEILTLSHPNLLKNQLVDNQLQVVILDLNFAIGNADGNEGLAWISKIKEEWNHVAIIVLTAHGFVDIAVKSLKQGATDFLEKPFANDKLINTVKAAMVKVNSQKQNETGESSDDMLDQLNQDSSLVLGKSENIKKVYHTISKIAHTDAPVLITGEHGSGKEVIARLIHEKSERIAEPFIHVDLGSTHESLFESILFGHAAGAFTDAGNEKAGLIETANLGTLFLDGIGELPKKQQAKLLTVLQNREVMRVGEHVPRLVNFRLICATHLPIEQLSDEQNLRQDLFFRINTVVLELPALRHRIDDLKDLTYHFVKKYNRKYSKSLKLSQAEIATLRNHNWPGNIRELKNTVERMVILHGEGNNILHIQDYTQPDQGDNLYQLEKEKIAEIIEKHSGNISRAAQELGIGRNTLYRKIKKYDL